MIERDPPGGDNWASFVMYWGFSLASTQITRPRDCDLLHALQLLQNPFDASRQARDGYWSVRDSPVGRGLAQADRMKCDIIVA